MNEPAWRSVAKLMGVAIAKLWLKELERQLSERQESEVTNLLPPQTALSTATKTETSNIVVE